MSNHPREEVERAFITFWETGPVGEDWAAWVELFHDDAFYIDHWWGRLYGKDEIKVWIDASMGGVPEIYTVLDWYSIDGDKVVFGYQNRRDNPDPDGPPYFDFPGLTALTYGGDQKWAGEEDYWELRGARTTAADYAAACAKTGVTEPIDRMTRLHWPASPAFARTDALPQPSWFEGAVPGVTRPSELQALLAPLREGKDLSDQRLG